MEQAKSSMYSWASEGNMLTAGKIPVSDLYRISQGEKAFGMKEYKAPVVGPRNNGVAWKFPQEKQKDFLSQVRRQSEKLPSPGARDLSRSWNTPAGGFKKEPRRGEIDMLMKKSKLSPGPGRYSPSPVRERILQGKSSQAPATNFITNAEFHGRFGPGPGSYTANYNLISRSTPSLAWQKPKTTVKSAKTTTGPGSYNVQDAFIRSRRTSPRTFMPKSTNRDIYDVRQARLLPGVGQYSVEMGKNIYKPNPRKR